jgi:two-component system, OmpR family, sensor histidine kinase ArlS
MYAFIISFILLLLSVGILGSGFAYVMKSESDDLQSDFLLISSYIQENQEIPRERIEQLGQLSDTSITIFDMKQKVIFTTEKQSEAVIFIDENKNRDHVIERVSQNQIFIANTARPENTIPKEVFNKYGYALVLNDSIGEGSNLKFVQIINKLSQETVYAGIFIFTLIALEILFIFFITITGYLASKKLLGPIYAMTETVKNVTINQLDARINVRGSQNEFRDLAKTFNSMLDRLQSSYEMQNQFVSDASHELRTPISVIQGYANLLDRWGKDDRQVLEEAILAIKTESEDMKNLIEKLLFLARGDKETQRIEKTDFDTKELIDEVIKETKLIDDTHEIVSVRNEGIIFNADRSLLKEVLRIFVDNSVKYTPAGGKIELQCYSQDNRILLIVEDNGTGISKEDLPYIFDRFYRADKSRTKNTGGTGLGMAIAKWIVLKHGGDIKVQSEINIGTKITISLPLLKR